MKQPERKIIALHAIGGSASRKVWRRRLGMCAITTAVIAVVFLFIYAKRESDETEAAMRQMRLILTGSAEPASTPTQKEADESRESHRRIEAEIAKLRKADMPP